MGDVRSALIRVSSSNTCRLDCEISLNICLRRPCVQQKKTRSISSPNKIRFLKFNSTFASGDVNGDTSPPDFSGDADIFNIDRCICFLKLPRPPRDPRPPLPRPRRMPRANGLNVGDSSSSSIRIRRFRPVFVRLVDDCGVFGSSGGMIGVGVAAAAPAAASGGIRTPANCRGVAWFSSGFFLLESKIILAFL